MLENEFQFRGFLVWGICALFFLYEFFLRTVIGTYQHPVMQDLNLSSFQFSLLSTTIFLIVYGLMQLPAGLIVDNIGLKKSLLLGSLFCACASLGFAYAYSYPIAVLFRVVMGFGAAFGFICLLMAVHEWMPHKYSGIFIGLSQFIGTLGPMVAAGPLHSMSESQGVDWRMVFICLSIIGFILGVLIFVFVENNAQKSTKFIVLYQPQNVWESIKLLFSRIQPWYTASFSACLYFSIEYLSENEGRSLLGLKGVSFSSASYMITVGWVGYALACPLLGFLSDFFERRRQIMLFCALIGLTSIVAILYVSHELGLYAAFFFLGFSAGGQSLGFASITEQFKRQFVAIGFGLNNALIMILAGINAPLIGLALDYIKQGESVILSHYQLVFNILIFILFIAVVLSAFFIKETFCKSLVTLKILKPTGK